MTATVPSMIGQFNLSNIQILQGLDFQVYVACNLCDTSVWDKETIDNFIDELKKINVVCYHVDFSRNPLKMTDNIKAYKQLKQLVVNKNIELIHCHTPVAGVLSRCVAHKLKIKVIYTAHGFHFFSGGPIKNWIIYYPIEKYLSKWTDALITINKEDFKRAKEKFNAKKTFYIPGVGVDLNKFKPKDVNKKEMRKKLGIPEKAFLLISVGELSARKNHQIVIRALGKIKNNDIYYIIAGKGEDKERYEKIIEENELENNVFLLGARNDIKDLCNISDCFIHPSIREGLGIAPLEAMACGLPLISSYVNGIKDYTEDGVSGYCVDPNNCEDIQTAIINMYNNPDFRNNCGENNKKTVRAFDVRNTYNIMKEIYKIFC